jgi:hypothetical protein
MKYLSPFPEQNRQAAWGARFYPLEKELRRYLVLKILSPKTSHRI